MARSKHSTRNAVPDVRRGANPFVPVLLVALALVASLAFHKVMLQLLQHGKPEAAWVLKTPVYLPILDLQAIIA